MQNAKQCILTLAMKLEQIEKIKVANMIIKDYLLYVDVDLSDFDTKLDQLSDELTEILENMED